ncbi:MAG: DUF2997 domain-containing protein [Methanolinea sp.]|jgi:hypothetical protein|nr:DUF2997 domain-containing protein [Methanolinea sp.]
MDMQELEIVIDKDGQVCISVKGAPGAECTTLTHALEAELGDLVERTHTAEFFSQKEHVAVSEITSVKTNGKWQ